MALELQHSLEESFGTKLPLELLMGMPSLSEFVTRLLDILTKKAASSIAEAGHKLTGQLSGLEETLPPIVEA